MPQRNSNDPANHRNTDPTLDESMILKLLPGLSRQASLVLIAGCAACTSGCSGRVEPPISFEPNLVLAMKYEMQNDIPMEQATSDSSWVLGTMFGTPDEPKLPAVVIEDEELASITTMDRLTRASGPDDAEGRGLFRKHCVTCHGVTGNGRGSTAAVQNPYPRDYRMGVFKFKSTPRGSKPTRDDLTKLIAGGIAGTAMKRIPELSDEDVQALVDYVIYLSWRGQHERQQIDMAMLDGIIESGEWVINSDLGQRLETDDEYQQKLDQLTNKEEDSLTEAEKEELELYERFQEDWEYAEDYAVEIGESWLKADDKVLEVPPPPTGLPLAESYADVLAFRQGDQAAEFNASVKRGQELFVGKVASCNKCHGETGLGDGQTKDYDDWIKDWTTRVNLKPEDRDSLIPLLARGALPPVNAVPRNFAEGVFRGGSDSQDLFRRITQGIDGTPMPAVTFVEGQFETEDVWHLINFIRSLQTAETQTAEDQTSEELPGTPAA
jgi:mono/diheme cytochrome c family protein